MRPTFQLVAEPPKRPTINPDSKRRQPPVILEEIGQIDLGHAQLARFEELAIQLAIHPDSAKLGNADFNSRL